MLFLFIRQYRYKNIKEILYLAGIQRLCKAPSEYFESFRQGAGHREAYNEYLHTYMVGNTLDDSMRIQMHALNNCEIVTNTIDKDDYSA